MRPSFLPSFGGDLSEEFERSEAASGMAEGSETCPPFMWTERDSVLWLAKLLEMQRTILHQRMWQKVQRLCSLPDSEYLINFFACSLKRPAHRRPRQGRLYLTSAALCFCYKKRYNALPLMVPLADMTALEVSESGVAVVRWGEGGSEEATLHPARAPRIEADGRGSAPSLC